jgi:hypothetical protein
MKTSLESLNADAGSGVRQKHAETVEGIEKRQKTPMRKNLFMMIHGLSGFV